MVECQKCLDPTAFGLFLVAVVSLPLAILQLKNEGVPTAAFFEVLGILIIIVALLAYRSDSNFGFIVFGLVGAAVALTGFGMGGWECITFSIVFILAIIWSLIIKTYKALSLILVTTALIFLTVGIGAVYDMPDYWHYVVGIVALFNFLFNIYLSYALALEGKIPTY
jgi:hypothetical protein